MTTIQAVRIDYMVRMMRKYVEDGHRNPVLAATITTAIAFELPKRWAYDYSNDPERNYRA